jgi:hypothetical protein
VGVGRLQRPVLRGWLTVWEGAGGEAERGRGRQTPRTPRILPTRRPRDQEGRKWRAQLLPLRVSGGAEVATATGKEKAHVNPDSRSNRMVQQCVRVDARERKRAARTQAPGHRPPRRRRPITCASSLLGAAPPHPRLYSPPAARHHRSSASTSGTPPHQESVRPKGGDARPPGFRARCNVAVTTYRRLALR